MHHVNFIIEFENGELDEAEVIQGIQRMIDDGTIHSLQGSYQRLAADLIANGSCTQ